MPAAELARRLVDAPETLLLVDVRPASEFASFHLPGSVNLDLPRLLGSEGTALLDAHADRTVVLLSNGMTHPAQAWVELSRRGRANVRILEEGLDGLRAFHLTPPSLRGPTTEARATSEAPAFAALAARVLGRTAAQKVPRAGRYATDPASLVEPTVVSTSWVAAHLDRVTIFDTRDKAEDYAKGHLPGAVHVPIATTRETRGGVADEMSPLATLAAKAGTWGLTRDREVVLYGGDRLQDPTHLALVLIAMGHRRLAVMEGGFGAWTNERRAVRTDAATPTPATYEVAPGAFDFGVELAQVIEASRDRKPRIVDARPTKAFEGEKGTEARGGHIPSSLSRPYTDDVIVEDGAVWWRAKDDLLAGYGAMGLDANTPVIASCRTGHLASQTWFTLRVLLGYEDVDWFDGSWKAWAQHGELPAETGPVRKEAP